MCIRDRGWTCDQNGGNEIPRKALTEQIYGTRRVGRPKLRWEDGVNYDARHILGNWRAAALDRDNWRRLLKAVSYTHLDVYKRQVYTS